jgi:hypothetical protein
VIGSRLKQSGMFWTVRGANAILALRCSHRNGRFEDYWEQRYDSGGLTSTSMSPDPFEDAIALNEKKAVTGGGCSCMAWNEKSISGVHNRGFLVEFLSLP